MTIVAEKYDYTVGVDTHAATHTYAVIDAKTGAVVDTASFPTTAPATARALGWIRRKTTGEVLIAAEGTSSYGARMAATFAAEGLPVCEVKPPSRHAHAGRGKSDQIDAIAAGRTVLGVDAGRLTQPRAAGTRAALRVLLAARRSLDTRRTADRNALNALVRGFDLGVDARSALSDRQVSAIAAWRGRATEDEATAVVRAEAKRLAAGIVDLTRQLKENKAVLSRLVDELVDGIQELPGVGPVTAAIVLTAYSHHGRVRSEAAFAALAGVSPIPASSGNTIRHRLNRHGDRQLNQALDVIARVRMRQDLQTQAYVQRRTQEGKTNRDIRRCLKRIIARQIYRTLQRLTA
jgi:transposase